MDSKDRFSVRAKDYARYRPSYPIAALEALDELVGIDSGFRIADIGSGTGIFSKQLCQFGSTVYGVEPNNDMRLQAADFLQDELKFKNIVGSAEETTLDEDSVDLVTAAQSFHWFDSVAARKEFSRILKQPGWVALIWNVRNPSSSRFQQAYENLLLKYSTDYFSVKHRTESDSSVDELFGDQEYESHDFANPQFLYWEELLGRAKSASYFPLPENDKFEPAIDSLKNIFDEHKSGGRVDFDTTTELYVGKIKP